MRALLTVTNDNLSQYPAEFAETAPLNLVEPFRSILKCIHDLEACVSIASHVESKRKIGGHFHGFEMTVEELQRCIHTARCSDKERGADSGFKRDVGLNRLMSSPNFHTDYIQIVK